MPDHFFNMGMFFNLLLEFVCACYMVGIFCKKRNYRHNLARPIILVGMTMVDYVFLIVLYSHIPVKMIFTFSGFFVCMYLLFDSGILKIFTFTAMLYGILACIDVFGIAVIKDVFLSPQLNFDSQISRDSVILAVFRIVLLAVILCMGLKVREDKEEIIGKKEIAGIIVILAITTVSCTMLCLNLNSFEKAGIPIYIAMGMLIINFILFFLIDGMQQNEKTIRETKLLQEKAKNEMNMYYSISENLDKQRKWTHEFKNHLSCISELAKNGELDELKSYIGKINGELSVCTDIVDTNHVIVNAVINTKYREALEKGIVFVLKVNDLSGLTLSDMDIVTILSNLLSNAFEACEQCREKVIKLKFVMEKGHAVISVKNTMAVKPAQHNGIFETAKTAETQEHGIGIRNVCDVLEKYNAKYQIDFDDNEFSFSIVL